MISQDNKEFLLKTFNINVDDYDYEKLNSLLDNILSNIYNELEEDKKKLKDISQDLINVYE